MLDRALQAPSRYSNGTAPYPSSSPFRGIGVTYTAYIENIRAKTGNGPEYYVAEAKRLGLTTHAQLLQWLKAECGLGHGHANAMILYIQDPALAKRKMAAEARKKP